MHTTREQKRRDEIKIKKFTIKLLKEILDRIREEIIIERNKALLLLPQNKFLKFEILRTQFSNLLKFCKR